jgi:hypothetical protein
MDEGSRMARDRSHDTERCPFSIGPVCKAVDCKVNGPTAKLLQDGYLTYQMVTIRRLCDIDSKVISLRTWHDNRRRVNAWLQFVNPMPKGFLTS